MKIWFGGITKKVTQKKPKNINGEIVEQNKNINKRKKKGK